PASYQWNGHKLKNCTDEELRKALKKVIQAMNVSEASVFVIQDYWTFDGYHALIDYLNDNPEVELKKKILPGIELRLQSPTNYRLNVHGIFSENLTKQQLEDFKSQLKIVGLNRNLSDEAIQEYARSKTNQPIRLKHGAQNWDLNDNGKAFELGSKIIEITLDSFKLAFEELPDETGVIMMPWDTYNGLEAMDCMGHFAAARDYFSCPHIFETRNNSYINAFLGIETDDNKKYFSAFQEFLDGDSRLPVSGSDAHRSSDYGKPHQGKYTWIKAEPCFNGLLQSIREPKCRSYFGDKPAKLRLIENNPTDFIKKIEIHKAEKSQTNDKWFNDVSLQLNADLVAIIGNKGSGKSALADIIALIGSSSSHKYFSFLKDKRFRDAKAKWANEFYARGTWGDSEKQPEICLANNPNPSSVQRIKYIPQIYFEELCSTDNQESSGRFENELKQVIFSHVDNSIKQNHDSLDSILSEREHQLRSGIADVRAQLSSLNEKIGDLENQLKPENKLTIQEKVAFKKTQLTTHETLKPDVVEKPNSELSEAQKIKIQEHDELKQKIEVAQKKIDELVNLKKSHQIKIDALERLNQSITQIAKYINSQKEAMSNDLAITGLEWEHLVLLNTRQDITSEKLSEARMDVKKASDEIDALQKNVTENKVTAEKLSEQLDQPNKKYQDYLKVLQSWNEKREHIVGEKNKVGSLNYLQSQLDKIIDIPDKLKQLETKRDEHVKNIYESLKKIQLIRKGMYVPVQDIIKSHDLVDEDFDLSFESYMAVDSLPTLFFEQIKRTAGTFSGEKEGYGQLKKLINESDFESSTGFVTFLHGLVDRLKYDYRNDKRSDIDITRQLLKQGHKLNELYDFIFGLSYVEPRYSLLLSDTPVEKLSPGQRGALLLIFYLLVDKDTCPIVLDQPEENLDNQTVYSLLVPVIKEAKNRRQVIMVTHNANLAVTCDAEQIIHAEFTRSDGNSISYRSGSIENPDVNKPPCVRIDVASNESKKLGA
ncbi:MAG: TrlF family AAA-like ATPase, partial [Candidatus Hodarchaeales archaeon]